MKGIEAWYEANVFSPLEQEADPHRALEKMLRAVEAYFQSGRRVCLVGATVCRFRHLLEAHDLGRRLFEGVHRYLGAKGVKIVCGTSVAPPSSARRPRPRMRRRCATPRWTRPRRAISGTSA